MKQKTSYATDGTITYYLDDAVVTAEEFKAHTQARDEATLLEMLAEQRPPHGVSDCTFMNGTANGRQFEGKEATGDSYRRTAEALGGQTTGRKYVSGLAAFPGDPEAWVDGRGDVKRLLEKRGWGSEGTVNVRPREALDPKPAGPQVAEDILNKYTDMIAAADPRPEMVDREDLKEQVRERIKPKRKHVVTKATRTQ